MSAKFIHLMYPEKFVCEYIEFIHEGFDASEHEFYFVKCGNLKKHPDAVPLLANVYKVSDLISFFKMLFAIYRSKTIIFHSILPPHLILIACLPFVAHKSHWIAWGGDLHFYKTHTIKVKHKFLEILRRYCIPRFKAFHSGQLSDYNLICDVYGYKGEHFINFAYPTNTKWESVEGLLKTIRSSCMHVMVGHSGVPEVEHGRVFNSLKPMIEKGVISKVFVPLSYGVDDYIEKVICNGEDCLGATFNPMRSFFTYDQYVKWLKENVDVIVLSGNSSKGYGNILLATALGIPVVMSDDAAYKDGLKDLGVVILSESDFYNDPSKVLRIPREENFEALKLNFSRESLIKNWQGVFSE